MIVRIWRDLTHAVRSLAKARAFTFVCVVSLGIGMAPVIAIQYGSRIFTTPPPSVNTQGPTPLVEIVTTQVGPHSASSLWSYQDFIDLRSADTGVTMTGWANGESQVTLPDSGDGGVRISSIEPLAYVAAGAIAVLTAVVASLAPARRAASVQPMVAIRST